MATSRVTIEVSSILQGGKSCKNPVINASLVNGLVMPCPIEDGTIELQLDGLDAGYCFDLIIDCEDCNTCPPQVKRICLCEDNDDCEACETCTNGICVSNCETDEYCDNGACKECLTDEHCPCNQECLNGECGCPPEFPVSVGDCCYACTEGETNESCQVCVGGQWVAVDCGENYFLNPETCECQECLDSGDCDEPNTCCVNGSCECCPGYYFDPASNGCLPIPDCSDNEDCPDCYNCVNGSCVEFTCPEGYVRTGIDGHCCVKECDCDNPSCPSGYVCTEYDESTCYCKPCEGDCVDNEDCSQGCGCYDGNCGPKPKGCEGPCYTGVDCAVGCGCLEGECVDCETLGCNNNDDCLLASGCTCDDNNCVASSCEDPCTDGYDCDEGCGCDEGQCKDCSDVVCESNEDCPQGCLCNGGICGENPCDQVYCNTPADCGENCGCLDGECVPCSSLDCVTSECSETPGCDCINGNCDGVDEPCEDDLRIERQDNSCELKGILDMKDCCSCPDIVLHVTASFVTTTLTVTGSLRKGTTAADPLLSATGIDNELPLSGSVKFVVRQDEIEVDGGGAPTGLTRSSEQSTIKNYAGTDSKTQAFTITEIGDTYEDGGKIWKVLHVCVSIEHVTVFTFENECQYKAFDSEILCDATGSGLLQLTKLVRCKTPLFTWSESSNNVSYSVIKKIYSQRFDSDTYIDFLDNADGLESCKYYKLEADCGCDTEEFYSCFGDELPATKVVFCQPSDITVTPANECNTEIDIDEVEVCDVMCAAEYELYINGTLYDTYTPGEDCTLFDGGLNIVYGDPIYEVKLVFVCDECEDCTITKTFSISADPCSCSVSPMTASVDTTNACTSGIDYTIADGTGPYSVSIKKRTTTIYSTSHAADGTFTYNNILTNGTYILTVIDVFGCTKTVGFIINACCQINVTGLSYDCDAREVSGTISASNSSGSFIVEIGSPTVHTFTNGVGAFTEAVDLVDGIYSVKVTDDADGNCYWTGTLYVGCGDLDLDIEAICDPADPELAGVYLSNFANGTEPLLAQVYAGSPVTVDGNGCPTDSGQFVTQTTSVPTSIYDPSWDDTTQVVIKLSDATGRTRCFPGIYMINCAENGFDFTTRFTCDGSQKKVCITPTVTNTYTITIGSETPFDDTLEAGVEVCYDISLSSGPYVVTLENIVGVIVNHNISVTACSNYTASYDCETGLTILQNGSPWTGKIRVDGTPNPSYWNYTGPNTVYLADTTPNHVVTIYNSSLVQIASITVSGIDCCSISLTNVTGVCDPVTNDGTIEFTINDLIHPSGTHSVIIRDSGGNIVESNPNYSGTTYVSGDLPNDVYTIYVSDDSYNIPNIGLGADYECQAISNVNLRCDSCTILNGLNATLITAPTQLSLTIYNSNGYAVNYEVWRNDVPAAGDCLAATDPPPGSEVDSGSLNAGGSTTLFYALNAPGTDPCFYVKFIKQGDPDCKAVKLAGDAN